MLAEAPVRERVQRGLTLLLATTAAVSVWLAICPPGTSLLVPGIDTAVWLVVACLVHLAVVRSWGETSGDGGRHPWYWDAILIGTFSAPLLSPWLGVTWLGDELSLQARILVALRNVCLVAAAGGIWLRMRRTAATSSLFLVMYSFTAGERPWLLLTAGVYLIVAVAWWTCEDWRRYERLPLARQGKRSAVVPTMALAIAAVLALLVGMLLYPADARQLNDWLPQSIGTSEQGRQFSDLARNLSTQDDQFDVVTSQVYGQSTADLAKLSAGLAAARGEGADLDQLAQRFSTVRDKASAAAAAGQNEQPLFFARAKESLHIPFSTYDHFDGISWGPEAVRGHRQLSGQFGPGGSYYQSVDRAGLKLNTGESDSPLSQQEQDFYEQVRAMASEWMGTDGSVLAPEFRDWSEAERHVARLRSNWSDTPQYLLTHYDLDALLAAMKEDPELAAKWLGWMDSDPSRSGVEQALLRFLRTHSESSLPPELAALLSEWTRDRKRGWDQIQGVVQGLRRHCQYDPEAVMPKDVEDTVQHFLVEARRGPDYLFASAAAVLLRAMGYPSRMVGGFYVKSPSRWFGATPVNASDVHYWTQVQLPTGVWVDLEPTPGFELPRKPRSWQQYVSGLLTRLQAWARQRAGTLIALLLAVVLVVLVRLRLLDAAAQLIWARRMQGPVDRGVVATWRLLERRARWAGTARPAGTTLEDWYPRLLGDTGQAAEPSHGNPPQAVRDLARLADWAAHRPRAFAGQPHWTEDTIRQACQRAVRDYTLSRFRRARPRRVPTRAAASGRARLERLAGSPPTAAPPNQRAAPKKRNPKPETKSLKPEA